MTDIGQPRHPDITVQLSGIDGNAMVIIATVTNALRRNGYGADVPAYLEEAMGGDYNTVLTTTMMWVNVE